MTKNNMSSLYWGKSGIVRLASTYPLYDIGMSPVPLRCNKLPNGRILNPISGAEYFSGGRDLGPSIHQCHHLHPFNTQQPYWHGLAAIQRDQGFDTQVLLMVCWYLPMSLAPIYLLLHLRVRLEVSTTSSQFPFKGVLRHSQSLFPQP